MLVSSSDVVMPALNFVYAYFLSLNEDRYCARGEGCSVTDSFKVMVPLLCSLKLSFYLALFKGRSRVGNESFLIYNTDFTLMIPRISMFK